MNTDEYEISLAREITVCKNIIAKITKELSRLEAKHGMTALARSSPDIPDRTRWLQEYEALRTWQQRLREYEEALTTIKSR